MSFLHLRLHLSLAFVRRSAQHTRRLGGRHAPRSGDLLCILDDWEGVTSRDPAIRRSALHTRRLGGRHEPRSGDLLCILDDSEGVMSRDPAIPPSRGLPCILDDSEGVTSRDPAIRRSALHTGRLRRHHKPRSGNLLCILDDSEGVTSRDPAIQRSALHTRRLKGRHEPRSGDLRPQLRQHMQLRRQKVLEKLAEGSVLSIEHLKKLQRQKLFLPLDGPEIQCLLNRASKLIENEDVRISVSSMISKIREIRKRAVSVMGKLLRSRTLSLSEHAEIQKNSLSVFVRLLGLFESIEIEDVMISLNSFSQLSLLRPLSSLKFIRIGEFSWPPELGDLRSLPSLYEDGVNNGRSNDGVSPFRGEDNHVISVPDADAGGIEEAGETSGSSTVVSHGTDGLESFVQSVIVQWMRQRYRQVVDNLYNWEIMFERFNLEVVLRNTPSYSNRLKQITKDVCSDFQLDFQLSQLLESNLNLRLEKLEVYCVPISWDSMKRIQFFGSLSDTLLSKKAPNQQDEQEVSLLGELESMWRLFFNEKWIDKIDEKWIEIIPQGYKPGKTDYGSVRGLFRFMRNRWHHSDTFQESHGLRNVQSFYNYFNERFPNLLVLSYGVAHRLCTDKQAHSLCTDEQWFEVYLPSETF